MCVLIKRVYVLLDLVECLSWFRDWIYDLFIFIIFLVLVNVCFELDKFEVVMLFESFQLVIFSYSIVCWLKCDYVCFNISVGQYFLFYIVNVY